MKNNSDKRGEVLEILDGLADDLNKAKAHSESADYLIESLATLIHEKLGESGSKRIIDAIQAKIGPVTRTNFLCGAPR
jgi:hypothetical protein